jgi:hypothetical protein
MSDDEFRSRVKEEFARLLFHWRIIELWIKKAEQINGAAVIPAMNELRYASRQLFNALQLFDRSHLTDIQKRNIERRVIIAGQYLFNAEHDIADAVTGFFREATTALDQNYGRGNVAIHYPEYPLLLEKIKHAEHLIADARHDYEKRTQNYNQLRTDHFPYMAKAYDRVLDAEVAAEQIRQNLENELAIAQMAKSWWEWVGMIGGVASILAVFLSVYLWVWAKEDWCQRYAKQWPILSKTICVSVAE